MRLVRASNGGVSLNRNEGVQTIDQKNFGTGKLNILQLGVTGVDLEYTYTFELALELSGKCVLPCINVIREFPRSNSEGFGSNMNGLGTVGICQKN